MNRGLSIKLVAMVDRISRAVGLRLSPGPQRALRACASLKIKVHKRWAVADRGSDSTKFAIGSPAAARWSAYRREEIVVPPITLIDAFTSITVHTKLPPRSPGSNPVG
jgi:hypothetical protein